MAEEDGVGFGVDVGATDVNGTFHERIVEQFLYQRRFVFVTVEREQVDDLFIFRRQGERDRDPFIGQGVEILFQRIVTVECQRFFVQDRGIAVAVFARRRVDVIRRVEA